MADAIVGTAVYMVPGQKLKIKSPVAGANRQGFFAATSLPANFEVGANQGEFTRGFIAVKVISVPIHDHTTIVHGGPAYGTYFDDDIER